jgi:hypothetical protein
MKGFICDRCGKTQDGRPSEDLGSAWLGKTKGPPSYCVILTLHILVPSPDLCTSCKKQIAYDILEGKDHLTS